MRGVFEDGLNSFAHVALGVFSVKVPREMQMLVIAPFVIYQLTQHPDENTGIDLGEFALGMGLGKLF